MSPILNDWAHFLLQPFIEMTVIILNLFKIILIFAMTKM